MAVLAFNKDRNEGFEATGLKLQRWLIDILSEFGTAVVQSQWITDGKTVNFRPGHSIKERWNPFESKIETAEQRRNRLIMRDKQAKEDAAHIHRAFMKQKQGEA